MSNQARRFNSVMPFVHHEWVARVLNMEVNPQIGPDLIDEDKKVEVKFTLLTPQKKRRYPESWTVMEHQMDYNNGSQCYWALGTYKLDRPVSKIKESQLQNKKFLEKIVKERVIYLVDFNWMQQYPSYETSGRTEKSEWEYTLRYPKLKDVPKIIQTHEVDKGLVHLTEGVSPHSFIIGEIPI